jgi:hypothetical protein
MSDFKKLKVWQKAHALSLTIDRMCKRIRGPQYSSLRSQLFRAVRKMLYGLLKTLSTSEQPSKTEGTTVKKAHSHEPARRQLSPGSH